MASKCQDLKEQNKELIQWQRLAINKEEEEKMCWDLSILKFNSFWLFMCNKCVNGDDYIIGIRYNIRFILFTVTINDSIVV